MKIHDRFSLLHMLVIALMIPLSASATVTLQFSSSTAKLTNLADASGIVTDDMMWGIIIDTAGDGFDPLLATADYTGFASSLTGGFATYLSYEGLETDDYFYLGSALTSTFGGTDGGSGAIGTISDVPVGIFDIDAGDGFALVWLPDNSTAIGSDYGMLTNPAFVLPTDGDTFSYASNFTGADPVLSATSTFSPASVPEPSALLLLSSVGALCLLRRRSRSSVA